MLCGGYENRITFSSENDEGQEAFRRPLLTEEQRKHMSESLVISAPVKSIHSLLFEIDTEVGSDESRGLQPIKHLQRGPFGVFNLVKEHSRTLLSTPSVDGCAQESTNLGFLDFDSSLWDGSFADLVQLPQEVAGTSLDLLELVSPQQTIASVDSLWKLGPETHSSAVLGEGTCQDSFPSLPALEPPLSLPHLQGIPLDEISFLLTNYKNFVIPLLSPVERLKNPWHSVFLPDAMNTWAAVTLKFKPSFASLGAFFSILAISAFSLRGKPETQAWRRWNDSGISYISKSDEILKLILYEAFTPAKSTKYKTVLVALLALTQASVSGQSSHHVTPSLVVPIIRLTLLFVDIRWRLGTN